MLGLGPSHGSTMQVETSCYCAGLGAISSYKAHQFQLLLVWDLWTSQRFWKSPQYKLRQAACVEEQLEEAWAGLK